MVWAGVLVLGVTHVAKCGRHQSRQARWDHQIPRTSEVGVYECVSELVGDGAALKEPP